MATHPQNSRRIHPETLKIDSAGHPGWKTGAEQLPSVGDQVLCTDGMAEVVRVLGRTQNGSRLLELRIAERRDSFFAAASNVLIAPVTAAGR
jgi:hypothetical protein